MYAYVLYIITVLAVVALAMGLGFGDGFRDTKPRQAKVVNYAKGKEISMFIRAILLTPGWVELCAVRLTPEGKPPQEWLGYHLALVLRDGGGPLCPVYTARGAITGEHTGTLTVWGDDPQAQEA